MPRRAGAPAARQQGEGGVGGASGRAAGDNAAMRAPTLVGERLVLRSPRLGDERDRQGHGWHAGIERNYGHECTDRAMTDDEARDWWLMQQEHMADTARRQWVIELGGRVIGVAFLYAISPEADRRARFAIGMFSPDFIGRGLGSEATRLVLGHAFTDLGLHRVDLRVLAENEIARRAYRRCGFVEEGRERESCWLDGRWHDDVLMGILAHEFTAQHSQG